MSSYCTDADVVPHLPPGGLPNPARVATGNAATDALECEGHNLAADAPVTLRAEAGGSLPAPLAAATTYYAIPVDEAHFKLAATAGGAAIALTTNGANFLFSTSLPMSQWRDWGARQIDGLLPIHVVPLDAYLAAFPYLAPFVANANGELAALHGTQVTSGASVDLSMRLDAVLQRLASWAKRLPVRGVAVQQQYPSTLAVTASAGAYDPRGWGGDDNTRLP